MFFLISQNYPRSSRTNFNGAGRHGTPSTAGFYAALKPGGFTSFLYHVPRAKGFFRRPIVTDTLHPQELSRRRFRREVESLRAFPFSAAREQHPR